jgi:hypothetical protein
MLLDAPNKAARAYELAYASNPQDQQIMQRLAEAYDANEQPGRAAALWQVLAPTPEAQVQLGNDYLDANEPTAALRWLNAALRAAPELEPVLAFRLAAAAILAGTPDAPIWVARAQHHLPDLEVYTVGDPTKGAIEIDGAALRWLNQFPAHQVDYGTPLRGRLNAQSEQYDFARFWWTGKGVAMLEVQEPGTYIVQVRANHFPPPPVAMSVAVDWHKPHEFNLLRGDQSWHIERVEVALEPGLHLLNVRFLNNGIVNGQDRDAIVDWIKIERKAPWGTLFRPAAPASSPPFTPM